MYLNRDKEQKHQLVPLKESSAGVHKDRERDAVQQIPHATLEVIGRLSAGQGVFEHHAVRLQRELVHRVDAVDVVQDKIQDRGTGSRSSVKIISILVRERISLKAKIMC